MYKIYINEIPLYLIRSEKVYDFIREPIAQYTLPYLGNPQLITQLMNLCENPGELKRVILYSNRPEEILQIIQSKVKEIKAGGGILFNELNEILFIYRRSHWDLPKGKMDPDETIEDTAVREVMEETGVSNIELLEFVDHTFHIYRTVRNGTRYLKKTWWYKMNTQKQKITIQIEEDIEQAVWLTKEVFLSSCKPVYNNILDILSKVK